MKLEVLSQKSPTLVVENKTNNVTVTQGAREVVTVKALGPQGKPGSDGPPGPGADTTTDFTMYYNLMKG